MKPKVRVPEKIDKGFSVWTANAGIYATKKVSVIIAQFRKVVNCLNLGVADQIWKLSRNNKNTLQLCTSFNSYYHTLWIFWSKICFPFSNVLLQLLAFSKNAKRKNSFQNPKTGIKTRFLDHRFFFKEINSKTHATKF